MYGRRIPVVAGAFRPVYSRRLLTERCITGLNSGPPIVSGGYNQNVQIVQPNILCCTTNKRSLFVTAITLRTGSSRVA